MRNDAERREGVGCRVRVACELGGGRSCWRSTHNTGTYS